MSDHLLSRRDCPLAAVEPYRCDFNRHQIDVSTSSHPNQTMPGMWDCRTSDCPHIAARKETP